MDISPSNLDFSMGAKEINRKTFFYILPAILILSAPYFIFWNDNFLPGLKNILISNAFITIPVVILGMILHELIHGLVWALFVKDGFKNIKFGLSKSSYTPYCHCKVSLKLKHYVLGGLMPTIVLGILPLLISCFTGNLPLFLFGSVFILAGSADIQICLMLRKIKSNALVQDYADKPGCCLIYE